jgi:hypothetical protein
MSPQGCFLAARSGMGTQCNGSQQKQERKDGGGGTGVQTGSPFVVKFFLFLNVSPRGVKPRVQTPGFQKPGFQGGMKPL